MIQVAARVDAHGLHRARSEFGLPPFTRRTNLSIRSEDKHRESRCSQTCISSSSSSVQPCSLLSGRHLAGHSGRYQILDTVKGILANRAADDGLTQPHLTLRPKIQPD